MNRPIPALISAFNSSLTQGVRVGNQHHVNLPANGERGSAQA
jgi:hypothetical protein